MSSAFANRKTWRRWQMDPLGAPAASAEADATPSQSHTAATDDETDTDLEVAREQAEQRGFETGYARGLEQGCAEGQAQALAAYEQQLADKMADQLALAGNLATRFQAAMDELGEQIGHQLAELAIETGQQLAGRALDIKPEHILDDVEELMTAHPSLSGTPLLLVAVDDLELVQAHLGETLTAAGWSVRTDLGLERGDCRVETEECEVDATIGDRWTRLLQVVGHGEH